MRIEDKSLNMDVQGQGCWDDCAHQGYWITKSSGTSGCTYSGNYYDMMFSPLY